MAIINHTHKFIFVHVPKSAGTTISHMLSEYSTYRDIELGGTRLGQHISPLYAERFGISKHSTSLELKSCVGEKTWEEYFTFSFVRHPIGRAISLFGFLKYNWRNWQNSGIMDDFQNFTDFVKSDFFATAGPNRILNPQSFWMFNTEENPLVDYIGKMENFKEDYNQLLNTLDLPKINILPTRNKSKIKDKKLWKLECEDPEVRERIIRKYVDDFSHFGYLKDQN